MEVTDTVAICTICSVPLSDVLYPAQRVPDIAWPAAVGSPAHVFELLYELSVMLTVWPEYIPLGNPSAQGNGGTDVGLGLLLTTKNMFACVQDAPVDWPTVAVSVPLWSKGDAHIYPDLGMHPIAASEDPLYSPKGKPSTNMMTTTIMTINAASATLFIPSDLTLARKD